MMKVEGKLVLNHYIYSRQGWSQCNRKHVSVLVFKTTCCEISTSWLCATFAFVSQHILFTFSLWRSLSPWTQSVLLHMSKKATEERLEAQSRLHYWITWKCRRVHETETSTNQFGVTSRISLMFTGYKTVSTFCFLKQLEWIVSVCRTCSRKVRLYYHLYVNLYHDQSYLHSGAVLVWVSLLKQNACPKECMPLHCVWERGRET